MSKIPKCPYSKKNQYYLTHKNQYCGYSKEYFKFIRHDSSLKAKWLSWKVLFDSGLSLKQGEILFKNKYFQKIRLRMCFKTFNTKKFINFLINKKDFEKSKANKLINNIDITNFQSIKEFVENYYKITSYKNHDINYYLKRGYSLEKSKKKILHFFQAGNRSTELKRLNSKIYNDWYKTTRMPGARKLKQYPQNQSKFEKKILRVLKYFKINNIAFHTPCKEIEENKHSYNHDFFLKDYNLIIEYNGSYWHKDAIADKRFNINEYMREIIKAKHVINYKRKTKVRYLILWEYDIQNNLRKAIKIIKKVALCKNKNKKFFSERKIDNIMFKYVI